MLSLYETIQRIVEQEVQRLRTAELGTVREQFPSDPDNYGCTVELRNSGLVLKNVPVATAKVGQVVIPAVGDLVLVQFVGGNINAPVIVGSCYDEKQRPPQNQNGQAVLHLPSGASDEDAVHLELSSDGKREIVLKLGKALTLNLKDDDPVIEVDVDGGKAKLSIARDGAVKLESNGNIDLKGNQIQIEAQGQLNLKGQTINLN